MTRVRWIADGIAHVGEALSVVHPGAAPTLPNGVSKYRRRFREGASEALRMLVRCHVDGKGSLYYAPHVGSLEQA